MRRRSILGAIIVGYDEWLITIDVSSSSIENTGGTVNITPGATRIVHWSDNTTTIEYGIPTLSVSAGILSGRTLTIGANTSTSIKNITITATYEDVSEELNIQQAGKTIKSYSDWTITVSANPASGISAAGGTSTITRNASRIATWTDDSTTTETATPTLSTNLGSISGNILTLEPNQTTSSRSATITAAHSGKSTTCTVSQNADTIAAYGNVNLTVGTIADVPASGGSRTSSGSSATLVLTWTSGRTTTVYPTITEGSISNVASKGTTTSDRTSLGTVTISATGQGNKKASKTLTVYLQANLPSYGAVSISSHGSAGDIAASGGDKTASGGSGTLTVTYTSGSTRAGTVTCGTYSKVSASSLGTTEKARTHVGTSSATLTGEGNKTATVSVKIYLAANSRWVSSIYLVPYRPDPTWITTVTNGNWNTVPASGGYLKSYGYYRYTYTSGSTKDEVVTSDASLSWNTGYNSWITSHVNGGYYVHNRTTTAGDARSATGTWSAAGFTATKAFTLQANAITNSNYSPYISAYGTPSVSIGSGITAGGGSATVSHSVTNTQTYYHLYTSGSTTSHTRSVAGTTTIKIQSNGNSRFSLSGNTLSHSSMGTSATTDSVTIRATNSGSTGKVKDASTSVTNTLTLSSISAWASYSSNKTSNGQNDWLAAGGGYIDGYCQANYSYTSGSTSTANVTSSTTWTSQGNYGSISGNRFTVSSRGTTTGNNRYNYIYASYGGKSASFNTGNLANSRWASSSSGGVITYGNVTAGAITNQTVPASGGTKTATAGNGSQAWSKTKIDTTYTYTSGSTKTETTTAATSGTNTVTPSVASISATGSNLGTTIKSAATLKSQAVTWSGNGGKSASGTMYVYQLANAITSYGAVSVSSHGSASDIPAKGGTITASGGKGTQTITYTSGGTRAGTVTCGTYSGVSANSLTTTLKKRTKIGNSTATLTGEGSKTASVSVAVYLQANTRSATSSSGGVTTYGNITAGTISNKTIPASGGSATATAGKGSQSWSKSAVVTKYTYTSGSTKDETTTAASSGSNAIAPSVSSYTASASSKGTTVSSTTTVGSKAVTWSANGKSTSGTMYVYLAANAIVETKTYCELEYIEQLPLTITFTARTTITTPNGTIFVKGLNYTYEYVLLCGYKVTLYVNADIYTSGSALPLKLILLYSEYDRTDAYNVDTNITSYDDNYLYITDAYNIFYIHPDFVDVYLLEYRPADYLQMLIEELFCESSSTTNNIGDQKYFYGNAMVSWYYPSGYKDYLGGIGGGAGNRHHYYIKRIG